MKFLTKFVPLIIYFLSFTFSSTQAQFSFKPKPLPECRSFLITELGVNLRLSSSPASKITNIHGDTVNTSSWTENRMFYMTSDLGFMKNINTRYAVGISHFLGLDSEGDFKGGLKFVLKRWFKGEKNISISPGIIVWESLHTHKAPGFTGSIDLNLKEWLALTFAFEYLPSQDERYVSFYNNISYCYLSEPQDDIGFYLGMDVGSYPGLIANSGAASIGLGVLGLILLFSSGYD